MGPQTKLARAYHASRAGVSPGLVLKKVAVLLLVYFARHRRLRVCTESMINKLNGRANGSVI